MQLIASTWLCRFAASIPALLILCFYTPISHAQTAVWVNPAGEDAIGSQIAYELREGIRRSAAMTLADRQQDARLLVRLTTLDPSVNTPESGVQTIYSVVVTMMSFHDKPVEVYLDSNVGFCGRDIVSRCAVRLISFVDQILTDVRAGLRDALDAKSQPKPE